MHATRDDLVEGFNVGDLNIELVYDLDYTPLDREYTDVKIWTFHKRYASPDAPPNPRSPVESVCSLYGGYDRGMMGAEAKLRKKTIFNRIWLYEHSGCVYKASQENPFNCRWDSGWVGWVFIDQAEARRQFGYLTKKRVAEIRQMLIDEVDTWNAEINGPIYGYQVKDSSGDIKDSCYGYVDGLDQARKDAKSSALRLVAGVAT